MSWKIIHIFRNISQLQLDDGGVALVCSDGLIENSRSDTIWDTIRTRNLDHGVDFPYRWNIPRKENFQRRLEFDVDRLIVVDELEQLLDFT